MPITISKAALSKSLREVRDAAREQGRAEGRAEAARMLEFAISLNGHGPATVKALREGINPAVRTSPEADPEDDRQPNTLDAATLAYLDALIDAKTHHADSDGGDVAAVLRGLIEDPAALEAALGGDVLMKAAQHAPKGGVSVGGKEYSGGEFIPAEVMANATPEEKAAVEGGGKPAKKKWTMPVSELREYADQDLATHITATGVSTWVSKITDDMLKDGGSGLGEETRWMYDQTQKRLKKAGIKSRDLFRSMYLDADGVDRLFDGDAINLSRMASWTDNPDTALQFLGNSNANGRAEVVISCPGVPASRILASHDTWDVFQRVAEEREFGAEDETIAAAGRFSEYTIEVNGSPVSSKEELKQAIASGRESGDPPIVDIIIGKSPTMLKAFDASKHPRGDDGRFIGREAIHAAKSDPALAEKLREKTTDPEERKKLDAALAGEVDTGRTKAGLHRERVAASKQQKAERLQKVRTLAEEISMARRGGEDVPPEHFTELAAELPHLTVGQLRSVRESLAASFWGRRRRDEMVTALVRHAKVMAERKRAEQEATDALDFGMEAMSNTGGTGHADAGRSDLNPWREFDADKNYGEAQHGGRMFQRHKLMAELPESDKTSHGTPDTGSILKQRGDVEPPPTQPGAATPVPSPTPSGSSPESPPPKDHAAALSKSRTHHNRRTDTKGTPIGRHVVYRDKAGKVNAVPAASYMGKELLAGRQNQYTVEGQYDFGPDGNPVKVSDSGPTGHQPEKSKGHVAFVNGMEYYKDAAGNLLRADAKLPIDTQGTRFGRFEATPAMADMRIKMLTGSQPEQNRPAVSEPDIKDTHQYTRKEYLGSEYDKEAIRRIGKEHKDAVEAAIATGKPVPPEVLADYPDLAAKYGPIRKSVASGSASDWDSLRAELLQDDAPPG